MNDEDKVLEVEVVEIDGVEVKPNPEAAPYKEERGRRVQWSRWQGQVRKLDRRWMPLWIALGVVFGIFILIIGIFVVAFALVFLVLRAILRAIFSLFSAPNQGLRGP